MAQHSRVLGPHAVKFLDSRGLDPDLAVRAFGTYTADLQFKPDWQCEPSERGKWLAFPFIDGGKEVNTKFRGRSPNGDKRFVQTPEGRPTFFNADVLDDPAVTKDGCPVVVVEGELDCMTAVQAGFVFAVSVPSGAPSLRKGEDPEAVDPNAAPEDDAEGYWRFFWNNRKRLKAVRRFIIAVDGDDKGKRLEAELVRRLGAARCDRVIYPEGTKDLNDVLMAQGVEGVRSVLTNTISLPTRGLYVIDDYPDVGPLRTYSLGWGELDDLVRLFPGSFTVVTGTPGSGKSRFIERTSVQMARAHGWKTTIISPEMPVKPHLADDLRRMAIDKATADMTAGDKDEALAFIRRYYSFIDADLAGILDEDDDPTVDWVIERAEDAVYRYGANILIIDPWNELEHQRDRTQTLPEYISASVRKLKRFARRHEVALIVIAHPTKEGGGKGADVSLYDIDGGAVWVNKADFGIILHRPNPEGMMTDIYVKKVRHHTTGRIGKRSFMFNTETLDYRSVGDE